MYKYNNSKYINFIKYKIITLFILIIFFSILYVLFDDENFGGINNIQEIMKEELLKEQIKKEIKEKFFNIKDENTIDVSENDEKIIDETTEKIKEVVKKKEFKEEKVQPSLLQKYFNRFYFSVITGTTLGYGDIYPSTNIVKLLTIIQTLSTIILILI